MCRLKKVGLFAILGFAGFCFSGGTGYINAMLNGVVSRGQAFYVNTTFLFVAVLVVMGFGLWLMRDSWRFRFSNPRKALVLMVVGWCLIFGGLWFLNMLV